MAGPVALRALGVFDVLVPNVVAAVLLGSSLAGVLDGPAPPLLWLGLGGLALGAAPCLDDLAAAVTSSVPLSERRRMLQRLCVPAAGVAAWGGYAWLVDGRNDLSGGHVFLTGAGVIVAVVAACAALRRRGHEQPGAAVGSVALLLVVGCVLFQPFAGDVVVLQAYAEGSRPALWLAVLVASTLLLWWSSTDPGRPGYMKPTRLRLSPGKTVAVDAPKRASTTSASTLR